MSESDLVRACLDWLELKHLFCWRSNNMGVYRGNGKYSFSGMRGVSDILGILPQVHAGSLFGNLLAVECKMPGKKPTPEQRKFLETVNQRGGVGICVHSLDELEEALDPYLMVDSQDR